MGEEEVTDKKETSLRSLPVTRGRAVSLFGT
jgi:hypothetical protein